MSEYKRLTKKNWHATKFLRTTEYGPNDREILKRLWELENKIENGTLIDLSCKTVDKVYHLSNKKWNKKMMNSIGTLST